MRLLCFGSIKGGIKLTCSVHPDKPALVSIQTEKIDRKPMPYKVVAGRGAMVNS